MTTRIVPKTELRDRIREELADLGEDALLITERGRPLAVVVSVERWNELHYAIEDMQDAVAVLEHRAEKGRVRPIESVLEAIEATEGDVSSSARKTG